MNAVPSIKAFMSNVKPMTHMATYNIHNFPASEVVTQTIKIITQLFTYGLFLDSIEHDISSYYYVE
jgi:hypothetical protein